MDLYNTLIRPIRDQDARAGGGWLRRVYDRFQLRHDTTNAKIRDLPSLLDIEQCPADYLEHLLWIVGFTSKYEAIVSRLDENTKRRLLRLAIPLWKQLYTELGLENAVRVLTGTTPYVRNWFDFRAIVGEAILGEEQIGFDFWIIGDAITRFDEYTSQVRAMDDGLVDETLMLRLLEIMRPLSERFEVSLVDFLDLFRQGRSRWVTLAGTAATVTNDLTLYIPQNTTEEPTIPIAPATSFTSIVTMHKFKLVNPASLHRFAFFRDKVWIDFYTVSVVAGNVNNVVVRRYIGGAPVATWFGSFPISAGTFYKLRVRCFDTGFASNQIYVFIDSTQVHNIVDAAVPRPMYGTIDFTALLGDTEIDNVELYRHPLRWAIIESTGTTTSSNWVL